MTKEVYHVVIRGGYMLPSQVSGDASDGTFRVNWQTVLPKRFNKFLMKAYFSSVENIHAVNELLYVECSAFPKVGFYDTLRHSASPVICVAKRDHVRDYINEMDVYITLSRYDSVPFTSTVNYPTEDQFSIRLTDTRGTIIETDEFNAWVLSLEFEGLPE